MIITDAAMMRKMARALRQCNNLFDLTDISNNLRSGNMQGHVVNDTWAITQVHDWPKRRSINVVVVVGNLEDSVALEAKIEEWAKGLGANLLTGIGRPGWWEYRTPGWRKMGIHYSKDI